MRTSNHRMVVFAIVLGLVALVVTPGASCSASRRGGCSVQLGDGHGLMDRGGR